MNVAKGADARLRIDDDQTVMVDPQSGTEYVDRNRKAEPDAVNFMYGAPKLFHNPAEKRTAGIRVILVLAQGHLEFPDPVAGQGRPLGPPDSQSAAVELQISLQIGFG